MPTMAFGTGSVMKEKEDVVGFVEQALDSGFDHIDTSPSPYSFHYPQDLLRQTDWELRVL
jgi:aryl-alcohol dehydrogenase-like predicted oxidoreductase